MGASKFLLKNIRDCYFVCLAFSTSGVKNQPIHILRELHLDPVQVDHVYRIGDERLVHLEAITSWKPTRASRLALYRFLLRKKFQLPVDSYMILMAERYAPRKLTGKIAYEDEDGFRIEAPYRVIRL